MRYYILTLLVLITIFAFSLKAQNPSPAPTQNSPILLKGGMVHVGNGTVIENGIITFENGKLTFVGAANEYNYDGKSFLEFDV
ncbi:MAG: amidohydrolase, partial [Cyclobacteriaceae bacterium]|nr:amidohydrolase [Cyclobacteriaceae bacterium]